ncbi:MAG: sugar ABC transporter permease [Kiloniellales bacterium]|nr:sugar ABC transporter permease [Kiloniellales bacterium]
MKRWTAELTNLQFALLLAVPVLLFLVLVVAYPLGYAVWMSLHRIGFFGGYRATFVGLENYRAVLLSPDFWDAMLVTVLFTVKSVVLTVAIGLGLALALVRSFPFRDLVRAIVILPWSVSLYGTGIIFLNASQGQTGLASALSYAFGFDRPVNFINEAWVIEVLAVANAWNLAPLVAVFLIANISTIPRRLYDLASIDRLSALERFLYVTLPPIRFTLFVFTTIATVLSMKLLDLIFVLSRGGPGTSSTTLTFLIYKESFQNLDLGYGAAMSFYLLAAILGSTFLLYFVWGRREVA